MSYSGGLRPKVQVITICYNQEQYIAQALESIISQKTSFAFEAIVADDASSDATPQIIKEYARKYPHIIKPILRTTNIGSMQNFLDAATCVSAEYVAMCEGDDYWTDDTKLQKQVNMLDKHSECSICFHPVLIKWENSMKESTVFPSPSYRFNKTILDLNDLLKQNFIQTNSVVYRWQFGDGTLNSVLPDNILPGDYFIHMLHAQKGMICFINKCMGVYRKHAGGIWNDAAISEEWFCKCGIRHLRFYKERNMRFLNTKNMPAYEEMADYVEKLILALRRQDRQDDLLAIQQEFPEYYMNFKNGVRPSLAVMKKVYTRIKSVLSCIYRKI